MTHSISHAQETADLPCKGAGIRLLGCWKDFKSEHRPKLHLDICLIIIWQIIDSCTTEYPIQNHDIYAYKSTYLSK